MSNAQAISGQKKSGAVSVSGILLVLLAVLCAGIAGLFTVQGSMPGRVSIEIGGLLRLPFGLGYDAALFFLVLSALSGYAGLAVTRRWRGWRFLTNVAACAIMALGTYGLWLWLNGGGMWFPLAVPVVLVAVAAFVLLAKVGERAPR